MINNDISVLVCKLCRNKFETHENVINHIFQAHKTQENVRKFIEEFIIQRNTSASESNKKRVYKKKLNCCKCSYETVHMTTLKRHLLTHLDKKPAHQCPYCPYSALQPYNLKRHVKDQHPNADSQPIIYKIKVKQEN